MPSPDLSGGLPKLWLEPYENKEALQTRYGNFALAVLSELRTHQPDLPGDILAVGDNWYQLSESRNEPNSDLEREMAQMGYTLFGDMWPIMERDEHETMQDFLLALRKGVRAGSLDDRVMDSVAVLDLTSFAFPIFDEPKVTVLEDHEWGRVVQVEGFATKIYQITGGFTRKIAQDLFDTQPGDDLSEAVFLNDQ